MKDERVLESLLEVFDDEASVLSADVIKSIWEAASRHQFDADRSKVREELRSIVEEFVDEAVAGVDP